MSAFVPASAESQLVAEWVTSSNLDGTVTISLSGIEHGHPPGTAIDALRRGTEAVTYPEGQGFVVFMVESVPVVNRRPATQRGGQGFRNH